MSNYSARDSGCPKTKVALSFYEELKPGQFAMDPTGYTVWRYANGTIPELQVATNSDAPANLRNGGYTEVHFSMDKESRMSNQLDAVLSRAKEDWADITLGIKHARRVLLWGPPGTGKSLAGTLQREKGQELYRLYLTMDTPAAEVRGHYLPDAKGGFTWHDGPGVAAWRKGGRLVIDELDAASGDTLTLLMGLLDDPESARLTLPTNELITPTDGFSVVATTNQQPTVLPEALLDRFDAVFHVKYPSPEAFRKDAWEANSVREAAKKVVYLEEATNKGAGGRPVGLRAFRSIDRLHGGGKKLPLDVAARMVVGQESAHWLMTAMKLAG
jgi:hypothetical protein